MNADRITALLTVPAAVILLRETDSTNTQLKRLAEQGAPDGTVLMAERQTDGRGRSGNAFASPEGGLYLSVLLRPDIAPDALPALTPAAALAVCDAVLRVCGLSLSVKWVNDLICGGKKVGGILTELSFSPAGALRYILVGVGLNATEQAFPPELLPIATSLESALGSSVDREALAAAVISGLMTLPALMKHPDCHRRYCEKCITIGKEVRILRGTSSCSAFALGLGEDYSLIVRRNSDGKTERISSGEVSVRGMAGYT